MRYKYCSEKHYPIENQHPHHHFQKISKKNHLEALSKVLVGKNKSMVREKISPNGQKTKIPLQVLS